MNAVALERYLRYLPLGISITGEVPASRQKVGRATIGADVALPPAAAEQVQRYSMMYGHLNHGWLLTRAFVNNNLSMPPALDDEYDETRAMDRLYNVFLYGASDAGMFKALAFMHGDMATRRAILEAAILAMRDAKDYAGVAAELGVEEDVVRCYEQLFFNVYDRAAETLYLASNIYDASRLVEFDEDYMRTASRGDLLRRVGMIGTIDDVRHMMGAGRNARLDALANPEVPALLESTLMANGYIMARLGWINQGKHAVGLRHAKSLINAAKAGGGDKENVGSMFSNLGLGTIIAKDMKSMLLSTARARREAAIEVEHRDAVLGAVK